MSPLIRIRLLYLIALVVSLAFVYRLFFLQIVRGDYYLARADRLYQEAPSDFQDRGAIYFSGRDGELVPAAAMQNGFLLAIHPDRLADPETVYRRLSSVVPLEREAFFEKVSRRDDPYEEITRRLDQTTAGKIEQFRLPGVSLFKDRWRFYPGGSLAAQTIGFFGYDGEEQSGRYGLERYYDSFLRREPDQSFMNFLAETLSGLGSKAFGKTLTERTETDLVLTIEPAVQNFLTGELRQLKEKRQAAAGGGVIIDPATGEIVALAALPDFDPGARQKDIELLNNPLVEHVFEFGSIVKPLTLAAALDAGVIDAGTVYEDQGFIVLNNKRIQNYDGRGRGQVTMQEVLNQSLNTGAVFAMQRLTPERFRQYMLDFGLGEKTGVDLPNEVGGLTKNLFSRQEVDYATASFGQGIALTPLGITRALAVLANGGLLIKPHLVKQFNWRTKLSTVVKPEVQGRGLRPETAGEITRMLTEVVDTALAGGKARLPNYGIAAKTGTAQMVDPAGGYDPNRFLHSFFGYFPSSAPRFLVFLYLIDPQGARFASETLTDPFVRITKFLINYYNLPPDR